MLTQYDIDKLMQEIQANGSCKLYFAANLLETREGFIEEFVYKCNPRYKVVELECTGFNNAYFEYVNYKNNPSNYHIEEETCYYDISQKYIHYYTVPNAEASYTKDINPRMPSLIYGARRKYYKDGEFIKEYSDPSPIKEIYTNTLEFGDYTSSQALQLYNDHKLDWKYRKLDNGEDVDGVLFYYVTSNHYIIEIRNFPRLEKPLVDVTLKTPYFKSHEEAEYAIQQLEA